MQRYITIPSVRMPLWFFLWLLVGVAVGVVFAWLFAMHKVQYHDAITWVQIGIGFWFFSLTILGACREKIEVGPEALTKTNPNISTRELRHLEDAAAIRHWPGRR
ncbi:MAG TPA: hypothetical protein VHA30_01805 [Patescibacteria group bacterium]|nr:hypothetical protein [Patescibacteria group bacterium]